MGSRNLSGFLSIFFIAFAIGIEQNKDITFVGNFMIPVYNTFESFLFQGTTSQKEELLNVMKWFENSKELLKMIRERKEN